MLPIRSGTMGRKTISLGNYIGRERCHTLRETQLHILKGEERPHDMGVRVIRLFLHAEKLPDEALERRPYINTENNNNGCRPSKQALWGNAFRNATVPSAV